MFGDLTNMPTDTLLDMLFAILKAARLLTSAEIAEVQQIQSELQRRSRPVHDHDLN
jgi:hypothetical protein